MVTDAVRSREWRLARDFAVASRTGPAAMAIVGEPGAGKSTLWRAGADAAADRGLRVLRSGPSAAEMDLPFAGLSDLLTDVLAELDFDLPDPQREALEIALLLRPAGADPPTVHAVGFAVLAVLRGLAASGPVLVAIDDAQWLDEATLEALAFALRRTETEPIGVFLTSRTTSRADHLAVAEPTPSRRWRDLVGNITTETVELGPLDLRQVHLLLSASVSTAQASIVARQSGGNPFWAKEIAASLVSDDTLVPLLARSLTDRLARSLSDEAAEALAVVAAAGRIPVREAVAVLDSLVDPAAALDEAVLAGVVTETATKLVPAHPLIGAAAVESLPPVRRRQLYQRLGETYASISPERYAHFLALAFASTPDASVAAALDAAATAARSRAGNAEAAQFAVRATQFTPSDDQAALTERRVRAAELLFLAGDLPQSLEQAEAVDLDDLDIDYLERLLPLLLDLTDSVHGQPAATAIVTGLAQDAGPDPRRRALVLASASDFTYGVHGGRRNAAIEAIRSAEAAGPVADASLRRALLNLAVTKIAAGEGLDAELFERAEHLEAGLHLDRLDDTADLLRGLWSRRVEDLDTARSALGRAIGRARAVGDDSMVTVFLTHLSAAEELAGDYPSARDALAEAEAVAALQDLPPVPWLLEPRCFLLIADGDLDGAMAVADQHMPVGAGQTAWIRFMGGLIRGQVSVWLGDPAAALAWFERAASGADEFEFADPGVRRHLDTWLAEAYIAQGRPDEARAIAAWLMDLGERQSRPTLVGNAHRISARAAALDGDIDAALESARRAVAAHETAPLRPELARSLLVLGQVERRRRARSRARHALLRARDLARTMAHQPLLHLVEQELPQVNAARSSDDLTATEQRVADLLATGATNREAAAALFVSVRTIETHVASIYRKLGLRNRTELTRRFAATTTPEPPS